MMVNTNIKYSHQPTNILVIDDDTRLRELLREYLSENGYNITTANNAVDAYRELTKSRFSLMVVDVMMPGESGLEFVEKLRNQNNNTPALILTALGETEDRIRGFKSGADDYLPKPFEPEELLLRIESILRRTENTKIKKTIKFGSFSFNIDNGELHCNNELVNLTSTEQKLLSAIAERHGKPVSREELSTLLNGISERSIDVQITRLRKKIEKDPRNPIWLQTVRSEGYLLKTSG